MVTSAVTTENAHQFGKNVVARQVVDIYNQQFRANQDLAGTLKGEGVSETSLGTAIIHTAYPDGVREYRETSPTISTPSGGGHLPYVLKDELPDTPNIRDYWLWRKRVRRLTPLECERLQGFPDGWTEGISDTQRYKCLGNAVTVNVIEAIGKQLLGELKI